MAMTITPHGPVCTTDKLQQAIHDGLNKRIREIVDEEAIKAASVVERRVREETAQISARLASRLRFESYGTELVIRVDFGDTKC